MHIERKWKIPDNAVHEAFQCSHQLGAIVGLQRILQDTRDLVPIDTFTLIAKLCSAAVSAHLVFDWTSILTYSQVYAQDWAAEEAHSNGMAQLFMHHWDALAEHPLFVLGVFAFWSTM
jgi:O-antigen ligase